jgi:biopolymer transport protein ExbB
LKKYLRLINGIATVTPLLGLLGTVVGMILAFDAIGASTTNADPKLLIANGISQALLTTAAGMSVAIPALIAYIYFVGRVDRLIVEIDDLGQKVVSYIASDAVALDDEPEDGEQNFTNSTSSSSNSSSAKNKTRARSKKAA